MAEEVKEDIVVVKCWTGRRSLGRRPSLAGNVGAKDKLGKEAFANRQKVPTSDSLLSPILNGTSVYITSANTQTQNLTRTFGLGGTKKPRQRFSFIFFIFFFDFEGWIQSGVNI